MQEKNSKLHRYQQESELKRKNNYNNNNCTVFLSQLDLFLLEKHRHFVTCTLYQWKQVNV